MKQNNSITKRISSGRKSRFLATWQMSHRVVAIFAMVVMCGGAWAQTLTQGKPYALYSSNKGSNLYLDPQTTTSSGNFTINTWSEKCILTFAASTQNSGYYSIQNKNGYYASVPQNITGTNAWNTTAITNYDASRADWKFNTLSGGKYSLTSIKNTNRSIGVNDTSAESPIYYDKNGNAVINWTLYSVYSISISGNPSTATAAIGGQSYNNGSYYLTTSQTVSASSVTPSNISDYDASVVVNDNLGTITITYERSTTPTTLAFTSNALNMTQTTLSLPSVSLKAGGNTISGTVTYSSNNIGCVSVSNTGVLTVDGAGTATITASYAGNDTYAPSSATMTITVANTAALDETILSDMTITPSSQTLDLGQQVTYTASESLSSKHRTRQAYTTITANGNNYYKVGNNYQAAEPTITETPGEALNFTQIGWEFSGGNGNYYTPSQNTTQTTNEQVLTRTTQKTATTQTFTITATGRYGGWEGPTKTATATVVIPATLVDLTALNAGEAINLGVGESGTVEGHYTWEPDYDEAGAAYKKFTYTSSNTSIATVDADGKVTGVAAGTTTITIQSEKLDGTSGVSCAITVNVSVDAPEISIASNGTVTIIHPVLGVEIRYTTDGSTPTATTGTVYNGTFTATNEQTIKAVAVSNGIASSVASKQYITSGVTSDGRVILYDYEDHSMTLYQSTANLPAGYPSRLSSPDPKDVKITYNCGGVTNGSAVAVSATESANTFIYYKTIEKKAWGDTEGRWLTGDYAYKVIPNPFSKRPATGTGTSKVYYGFGGWKIISGGEYINNHNNNDVLGLEEKINFVNLPEYGTEIVFEATWVTAKVAKDGTTGLSGGTYETNFVVFTGDGNKTVDYTVPATVSNQYPDGTAAGTATVTSYTSNANLKLEYIKIGNSDINSAGTGTFTAAANGQLIVGRGCTGKVQYVYGGSGQNRMRIESGVYGYIHPMQGQNTNDNNYSQIVFGCDYDRATNDGLTSNDQYLDNSEHRRLRVINFVGANGAGTHNNSDTSEFLDINIKSGYFGYSADYSKISSTSNRDGWGLGYGGNTDQSSDYVAPDATGISRTYKLSGNVPQTTMSFYVGRTRNGGYGGVNRVLIEGGELGSINGGGYRNNGNGTGSTLTNNNHLDGAVCYHLRVKGGWIKGAAYGTASSSTTYANIKLVFTGGEVNGWVAGACNGTDFNNNGENYGNIFIYVGGTAELRSHKRDGVYNNAWGYVGSVEGGSVYASGRGRDTDGGNGHDHCGSSIVTNVVVADKSYVERNVCGGGYFGVAQESHTYITGGVVDGGVYGGAWGPISNDNTWRCQNTYIDMSGGLVKGGIYGGNYGGKNAAAAIQKNATVNIYGGQVGTDATHTANVFGGGEGNSTNINQNVTVTIGKSNEDGPIIFGDVYGGSAKGKVNGNTATTTYKTDVTMNSGTINGSLYGGGLGDNTNAANVYGPVQVTVNGGSVFDGAVYGCNNVNGAPQRAVSVIVNGTDSHNDNGTANDFTDDTYAINAVYGGGNRANYTYDIPTVTVNNCDNSIKYVYGGGNQATVPSTNVTIHGGNVIGNVFGGGNNAAVTGENIADENKGTRVNIDGGRILNVYGGNNNGGAITGTIKVNVAEPANATCLVNVSDLYGGGNLAASNAGQITIGKCTNITRVFGGANQADVTGPINLNIVDGKIGTVFGGNNNSGTITGAITVNVNWDEGASTEPKASLGSVYGGGNLAEYKGNPTVNIINATTTGSVFGGGLGKSAVVVGNPTVNIGSWKEGNVIIGGDVFGGGDLAAVEGNPTVTIRDCNTLIMGDLYGGGNAAPVYSTNTTIWGGTVMGNVFGGGNGADPTKNPNGAQVGYKRDDVTTAETGNATLNVYGGTIGTWNGEECEEGTGGIFGGSNTNGNITGTVNFTLDDQTCNEEGANNCTLKLKEVYGSGNEAAYVGTGINFNLGCVSSLSEIYGGAKNADMNGDIHLIISSGHFNRVFGGNNLGGRINGSIKVTIDETGCEPVIIDELYGCGNNAAYSVYGYNEDGTVKTSGENPYTSPEVEIISFTHIGKVFGGGYGAGAVVAGNPTVNINVIPGKHAADDDGTYLDEHKLGSIGTVFGGGNAANVVGNTSVNIGTVATNAHIAKEGVSGFDTSPKAVGANITGNVYGGGNQADVTGKTNVVVGKK